MKNSTFSRRSSQPARRKNVLCVVCEDISPRLGSYGDPVARTPVLDRFAREGVRFTRMFSSSGVCAPSRAALITGMYASGIGANNMRTSSAVARGAAQLRGGAAAGRAPLPRVPARGRLLHDEQREDRLPVHPSAHRLGRERARRPLEEPARGDALLLGLQPRDDARVPGVGPRERPGRRAPRAGDPPALLPRHTRRPARRGPRLQQRRGHGPAGRRAAGGARGGGRRRRHDRRLLLRQRRPASRAASGSCSTRACTCRS